MLCQLVQKSNVVIDIYNFPTVLILKQFLTAKTRVITINEF